VQPVAVRDLRNGAPATHILFRRGESLLHNLGPVLAAR
jgi:hypothetical protein